MRVRRQEIAREKAVANSKEILTNRKWKQFEQNTNSTDSNYQLIKNVYGIPDLRRASMTNFNVEKLLDDPKATHLFRARKWFLYVNLASRAQVWSQIIIQKFTDKVNSYKRKHAAIKIATWYKDILDERRMIKNMAIIKRILVRRIIFLS